MRFGIAYTFLSNKFEQLGRIIVKHISWFLLTPVFLSVFLATGLQKLHFDKSDALLMVSGGVVDTYKSDLIKLFQMDRSSEFDPGRSVEFCNYASVIIEASDQRSILRSSVFHQIVRLDEKIRNFSVAYDVEMKYEDLCAKNDGKCIENKILLLKNKISQIENKTLLLKYPVGEISRKYDVLSLGSVKLDNDSYIVSAQTLRLIYFLDNSNEWKKTISEKWEKLFISNIEKLHLTNINVTKYVSLSREEGKMEVIKLAKKYYPISSSLMLAFTILTCLSPNFLRSKPWTGIMSAMTTGMSIVSGFGLLSYIGTVCPPTATMVPFLILGIGMDDTFVMLSAWMKTDTKKSLEERLSETFYNSGVSITITSLTNIASFAVGIIFTNLVMHRMFCIFMTTCLIFDYAYQITFVGAVLAVCGRAEERRLHSFFFLPLEKFSSSGNGNYLQSLLCVGHLDDLTNENDKKIFTIKNFWIYVGTILKKKTIKASVILLCFVYLGMAVWGFTKLSVEASLQLNVIEGSSRDLYLRQVNRYYPHYQYRLQLFIMEEIDYANPHVQQKVEAMLQNLESDPLIAGSLMTESWLRSYQKFLRDKRISLFLTGYNLTNSEDFLLVLRTYFLRLPQARKFRQDIAFNQNFTKIVSSRFLLQTNITRDGNHFYTLLTNFKKRMKASPYSVIIYHPFFQYFDIIDAIPLTLMQTLSIVLVIVFLISAILLPSIICIICVLFNIISVGIGVIGYMLIWNIKLSIVAIVLLVVVVGFSVDYAAHVSCAYVSSKEQSPNNRLAKAITMTGMPILQGCLTTILAIIAVSFAPVKDLVISVKVIVLACIITAIHGIIFVPVILSLLDTLWNWIQKKKSKHNNLETCNTKEEIVLEKITNISINKLDI